MGQAQRKGLAGFLVERGGIEAADLHSGRILAGGPSGGLNQATEGDALAAAAVVDAVGGGLNLDRASHRRRQIVHVTQLGDRAAIPWQGHGPAMHDAVEEPALHGVVVARTHDVSGPEAGEGDALAAQPVLGFGLAGVAAGRIGGAVLIEGPELAVGVDAG